jgi:hypothetical protein
MESLKNSALGPSGLVFHITPMPNGRHLMVEANINMLADPTILDTLDEMESVLDTEVLDPYTIAVETKIGHGVPVARGIEEMFNKLSA